MTHQVIFSDLDAGIREAEQIFSECEANCADPKLAYYGIVYMLEERGIVFPDDILAWATKGAVCDSSIWGGIPPTPELTLKAIFLARDKFIGGTNY